MTIDITEFTSHAGEVSSEMKEAIQAALKEISEQAQSYATMLCPVDTSRLKNSIEADYDSDTAYIGTNVEYAGYVELGTRKMKSQPFIRPAVLNHRDEYRAIAEKHLKGG